jgi:hypothetical protein
MVPSNNNNNLRIDNEVIKQFVENQRVEGELRKAELELRQKQLDYSHQYALRLLDVQKEDLADQRKYSQKAISKNILVILGILIVLLLFGGYCLWLGKDEILKEVFKAIMVALPTAVGGYYYGYSKGKNKDEEPYAQEVEE